MLADSRFLNLSAFPVGGIVSPGRGRRSRFLPFMPPRPGRPAFLGRDAMALTGRISRVQHSERRASPRGSCHTTKDPLRFVTFGRLYIEG